MCTNQIISYSLTTKLDTKKSTTIWKKQKVSFEILKTIFEYNKYNKYKVF